MTDPFGENEFRSALAVLADAAPEPAATDLVAAQRAWAVAHRPAWPVLAVHAVVVAVRDLLRSRPWVAWPVLAAAAAAVVLLVVSALPAVHLSAPQPASTSSGPGALPQRLVVPPEWTPAVTDAPVGRAAYTVVVTRTPEDHGSPYLVSAVGGVYRRLPDAAMGAVLSPDGRRLAWVRPGTGLYLTTAVVDVLDVPTGRVRSVTVPSRFGVATTVQGMDFSGDGERLLLWGGDTWDGAGGLSAAWVADLGPAGGSARPRLSRLCGCAGPLVWLQEGWIGISADAVPQDVPDDVQLRLLPADPAQESTSGRVVPLVDPTGTTRWDVASSRPLESGTTETFRLVRTTSGGDAPVDVADLGSAVEVRPLDVTSSGPVLARGVSAGDSLGRAWTVEQVTGGSVRVLSRAADGVQVTAVARDVAEGGGTAAPAAPVYGPDTLVWWAWHVRPPLLVLGVAAGFGLGLWLLVVVATRPWRRWLRRPRPTRHGLWLLAVTACAATGLAWLAAAPVVEAAWVASAPRPAADAPALVPLKLGGQRVRPPRAFEVPGSPRTTRLTVAFAGTVAGRAGVYGLDAGTGRVVRLDDLPGVPGAWPGNGSAALALSPSGRRLALWTDSLPDRRVAVVDLTTARVELRAGAVPDEGGSAAGVPWSPLRVDDAGALHPVPRAETDALVARLAGVAPTGVVAVQEAADGTLAGAVRTSGGWQVVGGVLGGHAVDSTLPLEGRVVVAAGALGDVVGQLEPGTAFTTEPWWTALGRRDAQPVGWVLLGLAGVLLLPAADRRVRAWGILDAVRRRVPPAGGPSRV